MARPFGLVAGLGIGAGIFYYRSLVRAHLTRNLSADLLLIHADVRRVMSLAAAREVGELARYLTGLLTHLANGGAETATIPAFAPQICAQELAVMSPLPLVNLLDAIADEVERRKLRRVAVFGARVTMETKLFGSLAGHTEVVSQSAPEIDLVNSIYTGIVEREHASEADYDALRNLAHSLIERERLDAIILAGTDLSFVFNHDNTDFPHLDGARTHIDAIMNKIVSE